MSAVFLALGSNLGDRLANLQFAAEELQQRGIQIDAKSKIYRSESVGSGGKGEFLNAVLKCQTILSPLELLGVCQTVEELVGRAKPTHEGAKREGERALDIDILLFGDEVSNAPSLQLPHPRALERPFVLMPLLDVLGCEGVIGTDLTWSKHQE